MNTPLGIPEAKHKPLADKQRTPVGTTEDWPKTGFLRLAQIIGPGRPLPFSKSTWWAGVKSGRFPAAVKLGPRTTGWRVEDIVALLEQFRASSPRTPA